MKISTQGLTDLSGWATATFGAMTAGTKIAKDNGFLNWVNDNAVIIGVFCTVSTLLVYALAKVLEMTLSVLKHRADRKRKARPSAGSS